MKITSLLKLLSVFVFFTSVAFIYSLESFAAGDSAKGKETFNTTCASCHGMEGKGDGVASAALDPKPRNLSDASYVSNLSDDHIFKVIKEGGAAAGKSAMMPPWGGVLSDDKIWDVIAYIRSDICKCQHGGS